jgi:hypothetical protein
MRKGKQKRSRYSRRLRGISTTKRRRTRKQAGGEKKCLFINWGPSLGLGNQLCIYAAAVIVKNKLKNWDICIPPAEKNPHTSTDYRFLFKQGRSVEITPEIQGRIDAAVLIHKNKDIRHGSWKNVDLIANSGDEFKDPAKNLRLKTTIEPEGGYYQNYGSIEPAIATIRPEIQEELAKKYGNETLIKEPDSSAFIHVRYGDYKGIDLVSSIGYFKDAKARLEKESAIKSIYIISDKDGIAWVTSEGLTAAGTTGPSGPTAPAGEKPIHLIDEPDELKVLYYMSQCKAGGCISASTYSIWGAIMGPGTNDSSVIIYPSTWNKMTGGKDLAFPERWVML